ncbi:MAG: PQQ-like beta-propeller repeat protein, partial [Planctomycetota bacterium]|nr:PQQ-like beta-propeller repeat protein [Planctomycetota bacterium]
MSQILRVAVLSLGLSCAIAAGAHTQDWHQWRGPARLGVAEGGPPILTPWPAKGPKKAWEAAGIPAHQNGAFGSISVVGDKAYLFVNWKRQEPVQTRKLQDARLRNLGWAPEKSAVPEELLKAVEEARLSPERESVKRNEVQAWTNKWLEDRKLDDEQKRKFGGFLARRLAAGKDALPFDVLDKLATIRDKEFPDQAALDKWFEENGITGDMRTRIQREIPSAKEVASDTILCLDASSGQILWKKEYPGIATQWGSSSTPFVAGDRVYVAGHSTVYCLDAAKGDEIWKIQVPGKEVSSSPIVIDGVVVILAGRLLGLNATDGKTLWEQKAVTGNNPSPAAWTRGDRTYAICNSGGGIFCVDPKSGEVAWKVPGGGNGTVAVSGDTMVLLADKKETGLIAYRLAPDKAEKLWDHPFCDRGSTPVIHEGHVYGITGQGGKAYCVRLEDGKLMWEQAVGATEISSPVLADGKVLTVLGGGNVLMFRASPEKFEQLGKAQLGIVGCSTPSVAGGRLFGRAQNAVVCYDLM